MSLVACLAFGDVALAQGRKLNGPLARPLGGDIRAAELSRDGAHLVYLADQDEDERFDLYSVDADAAQPVPVQLNTPRVFADVLAPFVITPEGSRVVYRADQDVDGVFELYVVPTDGSAAPRKLNAALVANGDVTERFAVSPDGKRALYVASQANRGELFSVPLDGRGSAVKLNGPVPLGSGIDSFSISTDSRLAVFLVPERRNLQLVNVLYGSTLDGRSGPIALLERARTYVLSENGKSVFVAADTAPTPSEPARTELYVVPALGGNPRRLATAAVQELQLAERLARVVYSATSDAGPGLFSVPSDGSADPVRLSGPEATSGRFSTDLLQISPDGKRALYAADNQALCSVLVDGSQLPVRLNGPVVGGQPFASTGANGAEITADGTRVVYAVHEIVNGTLELFSVPIAGGVPLRLNGALPTGGNVVDFDLTSDSSLAVYVADQEATGVFELFAARIDGGSAPFRVSPSLAPERDVAASYGAGLDPLLLTPDGRQAIYLADQETPEVVELFRAPLDGTQTTVRLDEIQAVGPVEGDVVTFEFAPGGRHVVYVADQDQNDVFELYGVRTDGRGAPVRLNGDLVAGGDVVPYFYGFVISPDGSRVAYLADQDTNGRHEVYSAPIDGSAPPVKLNGEFAGESYVYELRIDPLGRRVTFIVDPADDEVYELFSAPIDGSAPAVRLSGVSGGSVDTHEISPDGTRVIYRVEVDEQYELYSAPIDGSGTPVKLNGTLPQGGSVRIFEIAPDSSSVAYAANQELADRDNLYVVPIDGSAAPARIPGPSAPGTIVRELQFTPDGTRLVFVAEVGSQIPLFEAPSDASEQPRRLSAAGESVSGPFGNRFQFSADGLRLLYLGHLAPAPFARLCSVPVDGSAPRAQLSTSEQFVQSIYEPVLVTPAGQVVYVARTSRRLDTFRVPIDGSAAPVVLVPTLAYDPTLLADGRTVLYIGDGRLARVPIDGSTPPEVLVSEERPVSDFELDGGRVVFQLGYFVNAFEVVELFFDLIDGAPAGVREAARPRGD